MSSAPAIRLFLPLILGAALVSCQSAADRFDEFGERVTDAAVVDVRPGQFADISGEHLVGVIPVPISSQAVIQFIVTVSLEPNGDGTATAAFTFQPISADAREPVGDPFNAEGVTIAADGTFTIEASSTVHGDANPISGSEIVADFVIEGVIIDEDLWCGNVGGMVHEPLESTLEGSTFGGIRIEPGTTGSDLPEPIGACPAAGPDAGMPDAGGPADAGPIDGGGAMDAGSMN